VNIAARVFNLGKHVAQNYGPRHPVPVGAPVAAPGQYVSYNPASQPIQMYSATPPNFYPQQQMFVQQVQVCSNVCIHVVLINCLLNKNFVQQVDWINKTIDKMCYDSISLVQHRECQHQLSIRWRLTCNKHNNNSLNSRCMPTFNHHSNNRPLPLEVLFFNLVSCQKLTDICLVLLCTKSLFGFTMKGFRVKLI
jgi:hypothetical protein